MNRINCPHCVGRQEAERVFKLYERNPIPAILGIGVKVSAPKGMDEMERVQFLGGLSQRTSEIKRQLASN